MRRRLLALLAAVGACLVVAGVTYIDLRYGRLVAAVGAFALAAGLLIEDGET